MTEPLYSITYSAAASPAEGVITRGLLMVRVGGVYVVATTSARAGRRSEAVALDSWSGSGVTQLRLQQSGTVSAELSGLGTGTASWVRCSATGTFERCTPAGLDDIVGFCETDGSVHLAFGVLTADIVNGTGTGGTDLGWYDPRDYGAELDGVTDDLAAFDAMHDAIPDAGGAVYVPPGHVYLSNTWRISKPISLRTGIANRSEVTLFEVAPGRTAIAIEGPNISSDGNDAGHFEGEHIETKSRLLLHPTNGGSALGYGLSAFSAGGTVRAGDLYVAAGGASPTRAFRAGTAGTFAGSEPTWNTTLGGTTTSNGITFTCESLPSVRANLTAYVAGDQVYAVADNRFVFVCTVGGTTAGSAPSQMVGGDSIAGVQIGATFTDGTVTWRTEMAAGIYVAATLGRIRSVVARGFTGPAVAMVGGTGQDSRGTTDVNCWVLDQVYAEYCGCGVYTAGDNSNGWELGRLFAINLGTLQPTPNAAAAAVYSGLGGHVLVDCSLAGGLVRSLYAQLSSGRPVQKTGLGRTTLLSCYTEVTDLANCTGGYTLCLGGNLTFTTASTVTDIDATATKGQGLAEVDNRGSVVLKARLTAQDGYKLFPMYAQESGDPNFYAWAYQYNAPNGWWALQHGNQLINNALVVSTVGEPNSIGAGWAAFQLGHFEGDPSGSNMRFVGVESALEDKRLRGGLRKVGDVFRIDTPAAATWFRRAITVEGYRAPSWQALTVYTNGTPSFGIAADVVEPTTNGDWPATGLQVWKCTTYGTSGAVEPTWPVGPTPGVTTVSDGSCVWTYLGITPDWATIESLP